MTDVLKLANLVYLRPPTDQDRDDYFNPKKPKRSLTTTSDSSSKRPRQTAVDEDQWSPVVVTLTERVDKSLLEKMVQAREADPATQKHSQTTVLRNYLGALDEQGALSVAYRYKKHGAGRLYPEHHRSLGVMKQEFRGQLCRDSMIDIDIGNAHPEIMGQECERRGWDCPLLQSYRKNREETLRKIDPDDRKRAKVAVLRAMYGDGLADFQDNDFVMSLKRELKTLQRRLWDAYPDFRKIVEDENRSNKYASVMSFFLMHNENRMLLQATKFLQQRDWEVAALVYDGLMVYKRDGEDVAALFDELSASVERECGFRVRFEVKPFSGQMQVD